MTEIDEKYIEKVEKELDEYKQLQAKLDGIQGELNIMTERWRREKEAGAVLAYHNLLDRLTNSKVFVRRQVFENFVEVCSQNFQDLHKLLEEGEKNGIRGKDNLRPDGKRKEGKQEKKKGTK